MIRHLVSWNLKDNFTSEENAYYAQEIKTELEMLKDIIPGIISFDVVISLVPSSNHDVALNSLFESRKALSDYRSHPEQIRVSKKIGKLTKNRFSIDFVE